MSKGLTTQQKALQINLDTTIYGTFAEIGAGQEVAGNFFKAGASSGTVAKSISAYDMVFSDTIYGKEESGRYVCHSRLDKMLKYEYDLTIERLSEHRPDNKFFAFANTVSARNFHGTNEAHGWCGLRFQTESGADYNDLIIHVRMHDNTNLLQQKALGILGVNMVYASYFAHDDMTEFIDILMENLSRSRVEIDMVSAKGLSFKDFDNRLLNLKLLEKGITDAVLFNTKGEICLPSDQLYKKNILIARGSYRPPTFVNVDLMKTGGANFANDVNTKEKDILKLAEITITNLSSQGAIEHEDFLARVDLLSSINQMVLITNFPQYFKLSQYLQRFRAQNIAIVLGAYNFMQIFDDEYNQTSGQTLEALGLLFRPNVTIYLYPYREESETDEMIKLSTMKVCSKNEYLLSYVKSTEQVKDLVGVNENILHIYSRKVLNMIINNEKGWEKYVPAEISKTINDKCLFGHPCNFDD